MFFSYVFVYFVSYVIEKILTPTSGDLRPITLVPYGYLVGPINSTGGENNRTIPTEAAAADGAVSVDAAAGEAVGQGQGTTVGANSSEPTLECLPGYSPSLNPDFNASWPCVLEDPCVGVCAEHAEGGARCVPGKKRGSCEGECPPGLFPEWAYVQGKRTLLGCYEKVHSCSSVICPNNMTCRS